MTPVATSSAVTAAPRLMRASAVEGLLRGLRAVSGTEQLREVARLCGGQGEAVPDEVPVEQFAQALDYLARAYFPGARREEALFGVGRALFEGYRHTVLGKLQLAAIGLMGPAWLASKMPEMVGKNSNFGERTVDVINERHVLVHFGGVPLPGDYYRGLFTAGLQAAGAKDVSVHVRRAGSEDTYFDVSW